MAKIQLWRMDDPVLDTSSGGLSPKIVKGGMWRHQREWWNLPNFVKALVAGYGGGKTLVGAKRVIAGALTNGQPDWKGDEVPSLAVFPTYKSARRTGIPTIKALLDGKKTLIPGFDWKFHAGDHAFTIWDAKRGRKGAIWIGSGDDPNALKGPNVGTAWIDEPFVQREEVFDQVIARIRDPRAIIQELCLTGTPEELNWGYDICEGERKDDYDMGVVHSNTRENKALSEEYADRLERGYSEKAAEAYVGGKFVNLQTGLVYYGFSDKNIVHIEDDGESELIMGMDFNVNPMAATILQHFPNKRHLHIRGEIELPNADTAYLLQYVLDNYKNSRGECRIRVVFPDASGNSRHTSSPGGKSDFSYIRDFGFHINAPSSNPFIRDRENAMNGKFAPKEGEPTLTIEPSCTRLISYFKKYTHENSARAEGRAMSHLLDSCGYPVHRLYPIERVRFFNTKLQGL